MIEYTIVVLGAAGVGKTALTVRLVNDHFVTRYIPTIEDRYRKEVVIDHETCLLRLVDTVGLDDYDFLWDASIRTGDGFLVVFSLKDVATFEDVHCFWEKIKTLKDVDVVPMVLVGNKCDTEEPAVDSRRARARAVCYNCSYVETSVATGHGVEGAFFEDVRERPTASSPVSLYGRCLQLLHSGVHVVLARGEVTLVFVPPRRCLSTDVCPSLRQKLGRLEERLENLLKQRDPVTKQKVFAEKLQYYFAASQLRWQSQELFFVIGVLLELSSPQCIMDIITLQVQGWEAARLTDQIDPVFVLNVSRSLNLSLTLTVTPEPKPCPNKTNPHSKTRTSPPPSPSPTPKPKH
ncbi:hypothetical protein STEG23_012499 [Scotinomys teguina]